MTLAGCWLRDGAPAAPGSLEPFFSGLSAVEPAIWSAGSVAFGAAPAALRQPALLDDPSASLALVLDGRIDNRDELQAALSGPGLHDDAHVVLEAYRAWGIDAFARIVGDFAVALWDGQAARLLCARDYLGQRPLFYAATRRAFFLASEAQQLLRAPGVTLAVNEGAVAEHLAGLHTSIEETLWRDVRRLRPAHVLVVTRDGLHERRYWDFDPSAGIRRAGADGAEELRDVFTRAVECRLAGSRAPGVFLSGGLDSSSVAGVAQRAAVSGRAPAPQVLSLVFPDESCDETAHASAVVEMWRMPAHRIPLASAPVAAVRRHVARYRDVPHPPNGLMLDPLRARARSLGLDVVLTGYGGDDWLMGRPPLLSELVRQGRWGQAWSASARIVRENTPVGSALAIGRSLAAGLLPDAVKRLLRPQPLPPWIRPAFARRVALRERVCPPPVPPFPSAQQREIYSAVTSAGKLLGDEWEHRAGVAAGIDQRHPFYDRRVAVLGMALPDDERWSLGVGRVAMRRAMAGVLPASIASRRDKADFSPGFVRFLAEIEPDTIRRPLRTEAAGWVDGQAIRRRYREMIHLYSRGDRAYIARLQGLWEVAGLELWLEHLEDSRA